MYTFQSISPNNKVEISTQHLLVLNKLLVVMCYYMLFYVIACHYNSNNINLFLSIYKKIVLLHIKREIASISIKCLLVCGKYTFGMTKKRCD